MANTKLTLKQAEDLFQNLTLLMLGLDPTAKASQSRARIDWPANGAPGWKRTEDVAFLMVNYDDDPYTRQVEVTYQENTETAANMVTSSTRLLRVTWICYGPNSFDDADNIKAKLFTPEIKLLAAQSNLALITDVPMPVRSPELFNGQWWDRTTFYARFNELVIRQSDVPYIQYADVQIVKG